jgi:hypothetical protein
MVGSAKPPNLEWIPVVQVMRLNLWIAAHLARLWLNDEALDVCFQVGASVRFLPCQPNESMGFAIIPHVGGVTFPAKPLPWSTALAALASTTWNNLLLFRLAGFT